MPEQSTLDRLARTIEVSIEFSADEIDQLISDLYRRGAGIPRGE